MTIAQFEHVNMTVSDPDKTASMLCDVFGWHVRWKGASLGGGTTYHVGTDDRYVAIYNPNADLSDRNESYTTRGGLNHLGLLVDDLDAVEARVLAAGYKSHSHQEYEPGKRFYFHDGDGIEYEVLSYNEDLS